MGVDLVDSEVVDMLPFEVLDCCFTLPSDG